LIDPQAGVKLIVPQMEKVSAKLRQSSTPKEGMTYNGVLKPDASRERGHSVDVVIGSFRAQGLIGKQGLLPKYKIAARGA